MPLFDDHLLQNPHGAVWNRLSSGRHTPLYGMSDFGGQTGKPKSRVDSVEPGSSWIFFS